MIILKSSLQSSYTITDTSAPGTDITGLKITIPEDGYYLIIGSINTRSFDSDSNVGNTFIKLAINSNEILASGGRAYFEDTNNGLVHAITIPIHNILYLKKEDVVTVTARMDGGDSSDVIATDSDYATYIEAIKIG